ncbi:MAG: hypothetical protein ACLFPD_09080 [Desulfosudaceae bacterium]
MKITNADVIKNGEQGLIKQITRDLDWQQVASILAEKYNLQLKDGQAAYRSGDIVVHNNQVAYQLEFDVTVTLSLMFDRQGECFDVITRPADQASEEVRHEDEPAGTGTAAAGDTESPEEEAVDTPPSGEDRADLAADIASMISDINTD